MFYHDLCRLDPRTHVSNFVDNFLKPDCGREAIDWANSEQLTGAAVTKMTMTTLKN